MAQTKALEHPLGLKVATAGFMTVWTLLAAFPLVWIVIMSFKLPLDAFADDPLQVVVGYNTIAERGGISVTDILIFIGIAWLGWAAIGERARFLSKAIALGSSASLGRVIFSILCVAAGLFLFGWLVPAVAHVADAALTRVPFLDLVAKPMFGFTAEHYRAVWFGYGFYRNFINSLIITFGTVAISLTVGTLAGYALARANSRLAFWLLIAALIFRALPHSVLVTGYLPAFINSRELLAPLWNAPVLGQVLHLFSDAPPTLYGQPLAVIMVLVSINQPFTIWMLRSFFQNIPAELDEAARVDGCSHFGAFWRVIMPVMWPGVITTGLFSFLLAYNDYLVCSLLLDAQSQTMVPAITGFFNRETTTTDQVQAVAAAVSITAPLFLLVMVFQKQLVSGLTAGAVKG